MTEHHRRRLLGYILQRFAVEEGGGRWCIRSRDTGLLLYGTSYDTKEMAETQVRTEIFREVELLYLPNEPTALARVEAIIAEQSDRKWAARLIWDYVSGAKA